MLSLQRVVARGRAPNRAIAPRHAALMEGGLSHDSPVQVNLRPSYRTFTYLSSR